MSCFSPSCSVSGFWGFLLPPILSLAFSDALSAPEPRDCGLPLASSSSAHFIRLCCPSQDHSILLLTEAHDQSLLRDPQPPVSRLHPLPKSDAVTHHPQPSSLSRPLSPRFLWHQLLLGTTLWWFPGAAYGYSQTLGPGFRTFIKFSQRGQAELLSDPNTLTRCLLLLPAK